MKRPNKIDYLTSEKLDNRFAMFNYYNDLETYVDEIEKAIEVIRCCDKLKSKEPINFEEWMKLKDMRELMTNFYWDGINLKVYTTSELMKIYIKTNL